MPPVYRQQLTERMETKRMLSLSIFFKYNDNINQEEQGVSIGRKSDISGVFSGKGIDQTFGNIDWKSEERKGWDYRYQFKNYLQRDEN